MLPAGVAMAKTEKEGPVTMKIKPKKMTKTLNPDRKSKR
jgi:hypothetical protein